MDNKINGLQRISPTPELATASKLALKSSASGPGVTQASDDQVSLTDSAQALQASEGSRNSAPVDSQRVERLRQSIAEGSYRIDVDRIAAKLIELDGHVGFG
jgi:negative regulator of flagellin synthesis FlgM